MWDKNVEENNKSPRTVNKALANQNMTLKIKPLLTRFCCIIVKVSKGLIC